MKNTLKTPTELEQSLPFCKSNYDDIEGNTNWWQPIITGREQEDEKTGRLYAEKLLTWINENHEDVDSEIVPLWILDDMFKTEQNYVTRSFLSTIFSCTAPFQVSQNIRCITPSNKQSVDTDNDWNELTNGQQLMVNRLMEKFKKGTNKISQFKSRLQSSNNIF